MLNGIKQFSQRFKDETSFAEKLQFFGFLVAFITLMCVYFQLKENTRTNRVAIRGQLYQTEAKAADDECGIDGRTLQSIWARVPHQVGGEQFGRSLLQLITTNKDALNSKTASELFHNMFDARVFANRSSCNSTKDIRRLFLHAQTNLYHVHNAFDYKRDGILGEQEWRTWKGLIREMGAHPVLLVAIWQGHKNRYFSRPFAKFLQEELCPDAIPQDIADRDSFKRDREFIQAFYPEMTKKHWPDVLPDY